MARKPTKSKSNSTRTSSPKRASSAAAKAPLVCVECEKKLSSRDEALFVEEEVGRLFCSEPCIIAHFTPDIEKLEREYGRHVTPQDLTAAEREKYAHFRWMALEQPDEVWREKTVKGDHRYTIIAEFKPENKIIWSVAICLMLRGDPSFLYLAFVTSDPYLVDVFRKGEKLKIVRENSLPKNAGELKRPAPEAEGEQPGMLAEPWTEADSLRATLIKSRKGSDIPAEDFGFYKNCLEETLQKPNELWSYNPKNTNRVYHFIRHYEQENPFWYVVMAKDTEDATQIEIIEAFPTNDSSIIQLCRHGKKEALQGEPSQVESEFLATGTDSRKRNVH